MVVPGTTVVTPSVFVMLKSAVMFAVSVSVALLFPGVGSVTVAGGVTVAVFTKLPVAVASTVPVIVKVALPPDARLIAVPMFPLPLATPLEPAPAYTAVQVAPVSVAGIVSVIVAPVTKLGPVLLTTMV